MISRRTFLKRLSSLAVAPSAIAKSVKGKLTRTPPKAAAPQPMIWNWISR